MQRNRLTTGTTGLLLLAAGLLGAVAPWAEGAPKQMQITFGGYSNRTEVLANFPVLVVLSNNVGQNFTFADFITTNGYDLRFYETIADTGSGLNYEIESWNTNAGQASFVWVRVPKIVGDGKTAIWAQWGNASATNQLPCTTNGAVWDSSYSGVWHFPNPTTLSAADSVSNRHNGTISGATARTGKIAGAAYFNGTTATIAASGLSSPGLPLTLEFWVNSSSATPEGIFDSAPSTANLFRNTPPGWVEWWNGDPSVSLGLTSNQWYHLVFVYSYDGNRHIDWYKNGVPQTRGNGGTNSAYAWTTLTFGSINGGVCYTGLLDEIRVSAGARSSNWVWACYLSQASNTVFNNYGAMTDPNAPAIRNQPVADVTTNSATFNGLLASAGSSACTVCVLWGEEDGAVTGTWAHTNQWRVGAWGNDTRPSTNISLTPDRIYYYTFGALNATTNVVAVDPVSFLAGAVGVKTSRRESSEDQTASFVIYRPATATNGALAVNFTLGGTGKSGRDYDPIESPVIIPAGASEVRLPVVPNFPFGDQHPKLVTLSIAPGGYVVGVQSNATILTRPPKEHGD